MPCSIKLDHLSQIAQQTRSLFPSCHVQQNLKGYTHYVVTTWSDDFIGAKLSHQTPFTLLLCYSNLLSHMLYPSY